MGDRANICFHDDGGTIYFYTHWEGEELQNTLRAALIRGKDCWGDNAYLARIIFCEMIKNNVLGLTGYGISTYLGDNEHPLIHVYPIAQTVSIGDRNWSFAKYIKETI